MQECRKQEEAVARLKKDLDKQAEKLKEAASSTQPSHSSSDDGYHQLKVLAILSAFRSRSPLELGLGNSPMSNMQNPHPRYSHYEVHAQ